MESGRIQNNYQYHHQAAIGDRILSRGEKRRFERGCDCVLQHPTHPVIQNRFGCRMNENNNLQFCVMNTFAYVIGNYPVRHFSQMQQSTGLDGGLGIRLREDPNFYPRGAKAIEKIARQLLDIGSTVERTHLSLIIKRILYITFMAITTTIVCIKK